MIISAASKLFELLNYKKKSIEVIIDKITKFMIPDNEEPLRSEDFLETT
jgi:hypothetical protein